MSTTNEEMNSCTLLGSGLVLGLLLFATFSCAASPEESFRAGVEAYRAADYSNAIVAFSAAAAVQPASGTLQNLGNAEWQSRLVGPAILAWERALWVDPFNQAARANLDFARKTDQIEAPELTWYEHASTWLPAGWWGWIAAGSLWFAVAWSALPGILRRRKAGWHQVLAALGLTAFLLSLPALAGVHSRSRLGFLMQKTALRLTPTEEGEELAWLSAGEPARVQRTHGGYVRVRTGRSGGGWIKREELALISPQL